MWGAALRVIGYLSTIALGWMGSDINNESARTKQLEAAGVQPQQGFLTTLLVWVKKNWLLIALVAVGLYLYNRNKSTK